MTSSFPKASGWGQIEEWRNQRDKEALARAEQTLRTVEPQRRQSSDTIQVPREDAQWVHDEVEKTLSDKKLSALEEESLVFVRNTLQNWLA